MADLREANRVLGLFAPGTRIERRRGGWWVCWEGPRGPVGRRWSCRGQDFYPVWYGSWAHGGTASTALSQLVRWLRGQPVLPLSSWRHWASPGVGLLSPSGAEILRAAGYPEEACCVLCGRRVGRMDWWSLDGLSGPCCRWDEGCKQEAGRCR